MSQTVLKNTRMKPFLITVVAVVVGYLLAIQLQKQITALN